MTDNSLREIITKGDVAHCVRVFCQDRPDLPYGKSGQMLEDLASAIEAHYAPKDKKVKEILRQLGFSIVGITTDYVVKRIDVIKLEELCVEYEKKAQKELEAHYKSKLEEVNLKSYARLEGWNKANKKIIELQKKLKRLSEVEILTTLIKEYKKDDYKTYFEGRHLMMEKYFLPDLAHAICKAQENNETN